MKVSPTVSSLIRPLSRTTSEKPLVLPPLQKLLLITSLIIDFLENFVYTFTMQKEDVRNRNTRQRELIISLVEENYDHPTADEIYQLARKADPKISRGTVYRNLNLLVDKGVIRRLAVTSGPDHYDCRLKDHYHFVCRNGNKVFDTPIPYADSLNHTPVGMEGFKTEWHNLLLIGLCPACADREEKER